MGTAGRGSHFAARLWLLADHLDARIAGACGGPANRHYGQRNHSLSIAQATSRAFGSPQADRGLSLAQGPANAAFAADSPIPPQPFAWRSGGVCRRSGHSLEPQDWAGLDAVRPAEDGAHSGKERETLSGRRLERSNRPADLGGRRTQDQRLVHSLVVAPVAGLSAGKTHSRGAGQL